MRYVYPSLDAKANLECRRTGHTWPRLFPLWRTLLGLPQTCGQCGMRRCGS